MLGATTVCPMSRKHNTPSRTLATRSMELAVAVPQVMAHRIGRMMLAGPQLSSADHREFTLMGSEKVLAFQQSWLAMWVQLGAAQMAAVRSFWSNPLAAWGRPLSASRALSDHSAAWSRILGAGLQPVHKAAVANAKRLRRAN